ncbi:MAG: hypothetical protein JXA33_20035 [Anaerolineae bacterium]|nr:hypothetical protein [Anaerolineae bacterium]
MSKNDNIKGKLSEQEIDQIVVAQADDDTAWSTPVYVHRSVPTVFSLSIPGDLAARAAFLAQLHRTKSLEAWLSHIIQERVELEEAAFIEVKEALASRTS